MSKNFAIAAALGAALIFGPIQAMAQTASEPAAAGQEDSVVATVNGKEIRASELIEAVRQLPAQYQTNLKAVMPVILERLVDMALIVQAGREQGLASDPEVLRRMAEVETQVIRNTYLERVVAAGVTDAAVEARYQEVVASHGGEEEVRARHILLETEEAALEVIAALDEGGDFVTLAKEHSTGPSGPQGGDLGYFTAGAMVPEFSQAAFAMEAGSHSSEPVKSQFGYHVILVEDKRQTAPPALAMIEVKLREQMTAEMVDQEVKSLREGAAIEVSPAEDLSALEGLVAE